MEADRARSDAPRKALWERLGRLLFPRGVKIIHFVLVPTLGMALAIGGFRLIDGLIQPRLSPLGEEIYHTFRTVSIAAIMTSLIAFLAFRYRGAYEAKLQARNEELEATQEFLSRIIQGSAEAIVTLDQRGRVTSWNPAAEAIYGWTADEMMGQSLERVIPPDEASREQYESMARCVKRGEVIRDSECARVRKDGKTITVKITLSPIYDRWSGYVGATGIVRDVTVLKEMERKLLERERLAAVGELAAVVAHEVRNPLAGIRGGCEILLEGYQSGDARTEIGREVIHQVDRLNRTVHDLLLFARPRAMDPVPTDLHALLDRTLNNLRDDPDNHDVITTRQYVPDLPIVSVDPRQFEQVFLNLALNAAQAMNHKGTLTVATYRNRLGVEVVFQDTGPGVAPERIENLFKPFYTTRSQGTGLGLAIVKRIVEAHGGHIEVSLPEGGGARFAIHLPTTGAERT